MHSWPYTTAVLIAIFVWKPKDVFSSTCNFNISHAEFNITSAESEHCNTSIWVISALQKDTVKIRFETFQLSDSQEYGHNWMKIYDGQSTSDTSLGVFTGARRPFTVQSSGHFMLVELIKQGLHLTSLCNFTGVGSFYSTKDKPNVWIPDKNVRTAPGLFVWCYAEGSPSINISIYKNSTLLANGTGLVMTRLNESGIYSCVATNEAGCDRETFSVTVVEADCGNLCFNHGIVMNGQVENKVLCNASSSSIVDIFECLPTTATILNVTRTNITYLPKEAFRRMDGLKILDIRNNKIEELQEDVFSDLFCLQELFLSRNKMQELKENVFSKLVNLQLLDLSDNAIRHLPRRIFSGPSQLLSLDLKWNHIKELPTELFRNLLKLEELDLSNNFIRGLHPRIFAGPSELLSLDLKGNRIEELPTELFFDLSRLEELDLSNNFIRRLHPRIFAGLSQLLSLNLKRNRVEDLPNGLFCNLSKLERLLLSGNNIQDLTENIFSNLVNLQHLDLSTNAIHQLHPRIFQGLFQLRFLSLRWNSIEKLPKRLFLNLSELEELSLGKNKILHLTNETFSNLRNLIFLDLESNKIPSLPTEIFSNLRKLKHLFLQRNRIANITKEMFTNLVNVQHLMLNDNKLRSIPEEAFINITGLRILLLSDNNITTIGDKAFTISHQGLLLVYILRTKLTEFHIGKFNNIKNLIAKATVKEFRPTAVRFWDKDDILRCRLHIRPEEYHNETIEILNDTGRLRDIVLRTFVQAGFAKKGNHTYQKYPCPRGWFFNSSFDDNTEFECEKCHTGGFYAGSEALVRNECERCETGAHVSFVRAPGVDRQDCYTCPRGSNTSAFAGYRGCPCLDNFFRTDRFGNCYPCRELPTGLTCENDLGSLEPGYWWRWLNKTREKLYTDFAVDLLDIKYRPGRRIKSAKTYNAHNAFPYANHSDIPRPHKCEREKSCKGAIHSYCEPEYRGPMCEICIPGYYKKLKRCMQCPTKNWIIVKLVILAAAVAIIIAFLVWIGTKKRNERSSVDLILGTLKIVIGSYQVTYGIMESFSYVTWPESLELIAEYSEFLQLRFFQIAPIYCFMPNFKTDAFGSLFAILALNAAAIGLSALVYVLIKLFLLVSTWSEEQKQKKASRAKALIYRNLFFFLYATYLSTCAMTARVLPSNCRRVCLDNENTVCSVYLKADYTIKCEGQGYYSLVLVAYCAIPYIVFLPVASLWVVWRNWMMVAGNAIQDGREALEPQGREIITGLRFLFENYETPKWYWEFFEIFRKLLLSCGLILLGGHSRAYVGSAAVMSALYGTAFASKRPMKNKFEYSLMVISLGVSFTNLGVGTISNIPEEKAPIELKLYAYMDSIFFQLPVFVINSAVVGYLVAHYLECVHLNIREWFESPELSFSCFLAIFLPLHEFKSETRSNSEGDISTQQLLPADSLRSDSLTDSELGLNDSTEEDINLTSKA